MADKKTVLPKEIQKLVDEVQQKEQQEFKDIIQEEKKKRKGKWDVPLDQPVKYFDKRLSYELTGYIPITEDRSLDFDPSWFTEARDNKIKTGRYTQSRYGTKGYSDFWDEEYRRCRDGYTSHGYTIPGPYYYYLNYYQLPNIDVDKAGTGRDQIFPKFLVFQYEFFHYFEMCRMLRKDACLMKARGIENSTPCK